MLTLRGIKKNYTVGDQEIPALKGVDIAFRRSEFVSILGPSGCGKTTLLNIIGGLDRYTEGDMTINSVSTKRVYRRGLGFLSKPFRGLCVSKLQPDSPSDGAFQRGTGADPLRRVQGPAAQAGRCRAGTGGAGGSN